MLLTLFFKELPDLEYVLDKMDFYTPKKEFLNFEKKYKDSDLYLSDIHFVTYHKKKGDKFIITSQFCTLYMLEKLSEHDKKMNNNTKTKINKLLYENDNSEAEIEEFKVNSFDKADIIFKIKLNKNDLFTRKTLDSLRESFNKKFYYDLKLTDSLMKKATFKENRELFKLFHRNLSLYDSIYTSEKSIKKFIKNPLEKIDIDDESTLVIYDINSNKENLLLLKDRKELKMKYNNILKNFKKYSFFQKYFYYPIFYKNNTRDLQKEFKFIKL